MISAWGIEHTFSKGLQPRNMRSLMNTSRGRQVFGKPREGGGFTSDSNKLVHGTPRAREYAQAKMDLRLGDVAPAEAKKTLRRLTRTRRQDRGKLP